MDIVNLVILNDIRRGFSRDFLSFCTIRRKRNVFSQLKMLFHIKKVHKIYNHLYFTMVMVGQISQYIFFRDRLLDISHALSHDCDTYTTTDKIQLETYKDLIKSTHSSIYHCLYIMGILCSYIIKFMFYNQNMSVLYSQCGFDVI